MEQAKVVENVEDLSTQLYTGACSMNRSTFFMVCETMEHMCTAFKMNTAIKILAKCLFNNYITTSGGLGDPYLKEYSFACVYIAGVVLKEHPKDKKEVCAYTTRPLDEDKMDIAISTICTVLEGKLMIPTHGIFVCELSTTQDEYDKTVKLVNVCLLDKSFHNYLPIKLSTACHIFVTEKYLKKVDPNYAVIMVHIYSYLTGQETGLWKDYVDRIDNIYMSSQGRHKNVFASSGYSNIGRRDLIQRYITEGGYRCCSDKNFDIPRDKEPMKISRYINDDTARRTMLGEGAFGKVYKIGNPSNEVAVKEQHEDEPAIRELAIMKTLKNDNIQSADKFLIERNAVYMSMTIQKCSLLDLIEEASGVQDAGPYVKRVWVNHERNVLGVIDIHLRRSLALDLMKGLEYLHRMGVLHRDMKPNNLLITHNNTLKIADFGLATLLIPISRCGNITLSKDVYVPEYKDPYIAKCILREQDTGVFQRCDYGYSSDLWAAGIVLLEMETGVGPLANFISDDLIYEEMMKILFLPDRRVRPHLFDCIEDKEFSRLCQKIIVYAPDERISTFTAVSLLNNMRR